jgi:hypothetical protein
MNHWLRKRRHQDAGQCERDGANQADARGEKDDAGMGDSVPGWQTSGTLEGQRKLERLDAGELLILVRRFGLGLFRRHGLYHSSTLFYINHLIRLDVLERIHLSARPANLEHFEFLRFPQTKMHA